MSEAHAIYCNPDDYDGPDYSPFRCLCGVTFPGVGVASPDKHRPLWHLAAHHINETVPGSNIDTERL